MRPASFEGNYLYLAKVTCNSLSPSEKVKVKDYLELRFGPENLYSYRPISINSYQTNIEGEGEGIWKTQQK